MGLTLSRDCTDVGENSAIIYYKGELKVSDVTITEIYGKIGQQFFNEKDSGSVTITGLKSGTHYQFDGEITYKYKWVSGKDENGNAIYSNDSKKYTDSIDIYTHPGKFEMGATINTSSNKNIIANVLDSEIINNEWIPHFQAAYCWYKQNDINYSPANITYDYSSNSNNGGMKVKQNDPISAEWFNNCMEGMEEFGKTVDYVSKNELITADLINQMNFSGKS